ncbi:MAG: DUF6390 family protein [Acidimicrobiia bacterium]
MISGPALFGQYAFPPNVHGYCGPADAGLTEGLVSVDASAELRHIVQQFEGAWPYLELIGGCTGMDPLDPMVVEAYWVGNALLDRIDTLVWGNSMDGRFRRRAGASWDNIDGGIPGGRPNHAFHVFCVYPWVGLLRSGYADHALEVIDRCRIRWGTVLGVDGDRAVVECRPLVWNGEDLALGEIERETVRMSVSGSPVNAGDIVALHWDYVCDVLTRRQLGRLRQETARHMRIANQPTRELESVMES